MMKRAFDVVVSGVALLLLWPLGLAVAVAVAVESGRPVLFCQQRVGLGGRSFGMFKFRSMVVGAAAVGPYFTQSQDVRVTRVGRFIRRTSLDELPQLLNVLKGDMSLVGPRPDLPVQRDGYTEHDWAERCSVRPGITGLAQVVARSEATPAERLALDLAYVRQHNGFMDMGIVWRTLGRLSGKGSN
jgi:lipopolysaccharide/colanic/teichoic acid biosynthesis glycosyltransferase